MGVALQGGRNEEYMSCNGDRSLEVQQCSRTSGLANMAIEFLPSEEEILQMVARLVVQYNRS